MDDGNVSTVAGFLETKTPDGRWISRFFRLDGARGTIVGGTRRDSKLVKTYLAPLPQGVPLADACTVRHEDDSRTAAVAGGEAKCYYFTVVRSMGRGRASTELHFRCALVEERDRWLAAFRSLGVKVETRRGLAVPVKTRSFLFPSNPPSTPPPSSATDVLAEPAPPPPMVPTPRAKARLTGVDAHEAAVAAAAASAANARSAAALMLPAEMITIHEVSDLSSADFLSPPSDEDALPAVAAKDETIETAAAAAAELAEIEAELATLAAEETSAAKAAAAAAKSAKAEAEVKRVAAAHSAAELSFYFGGDTDAAEAALASEEADAADAAAASEIAEAEAEAKAAQRLDQTRAAAAGAETKAMTARAAAAFADVDAAEEAEAGAKRDDAAAAVKAELDAALVVEAEAARAAAATAETAQIAADLQAELDAALAVEAEAARAAVAKAEAARTAAALQKAKDDRREARRSRKAEKQEARVRLRASEVEAEAAALAAAEIEAAVASQLRLDEERRAEEERLDAIAAAKARLKADADARANARIGAKASAREHAAREAAQIDTVIAVNLGQYNDDAANRAPDAREAAETLAEAKARADPGVRPAVAPAACTAGQREDAVDSVPSPPVVQLQLEWTHEDEMVCEAIERLEYAQLHGEYQLRFSSNWVRMRSSASDIRALFDLGYTADLLRSGARPPCEDTSWAELSHAERCAAKTLGVPAALWDRRIARRSSEALKESLLQRSAPVVVEEDGKRVAMTRADAVKDLSLRTLQRQYAAEEMQARAAASVLANAPSNASIAAEERRRAADPDNGTVIVDMRKRRGSIGLVASLGSLSSQSAPTALCEVVRSQLDSIVASRSEEEIDEREHSATALEFRGLESRAAALVAVLNGKSHVNELLLEEGAADDLQTYYSSPPHIALLENSSTFQKQPSPLSLPLPSHVAQQQQGGTKIEGVHIDRCGNVSIQHDFDSSSEKRAFDVSQPTVFTPERSSVVRNDGVKCDAGSPTTTESAAAELADSPLLPPPKCGICHASETLVQTLYVPSVGADVCTACFERYVAMMGTHGFDPDTARMAATAGPHTVEEERRVSVSDKTENRAARVAMRSAASEALSTALAARAAAFAAVTLACGAVLSSASRQEQTEKSEREADEMLQRVVEAEKIAIAELQDSEIRWERSAEAETQSDALWEKLLLLESRAEHVGAAEDDDRNSAPSTAVSNTNGGGDDAASNHAAEDDEDDQLWTVLRKMSNDGGFTPAQKLEYESNSTREMPRRSVEGGSEDEDRSETGGFVPAAVTTDRDLHYGGRERKSASAATALGGVDSSARVPQSNDMDRPPGQFTLNATHSLPNTRRPVPPSAFPPHTSPPRKGVDYDSSESRSSRLDQLWNKLMWEHTPLPNLVAYVPERREQIMSPLGSAHVEGGGRELNEFELSIEGDDAGVVSEDSLDAMDPQEQECEEIEEEEEEEEECGEIASVDSGGLDETVEIETEIETEMETETSKCVEKGGVEAEAEAETFERNVGAGSNQDGSRFDGLDDTIEKEASPSSSDEQLDDTVELDVEELRVPLEGDNQREHNAANTPPALTMAGQSAAPNVHINRHGSISINQARPLVQPPPDAAAKGTSTTHPAIAVAMRKRVVLLGSMEFAVDDMVRALGGGICRSLDLALFCELINHYFDGCYPRPDVPETVLLNLFAEFGEWPTGECESSTSGRVAESITVEQLRDGVRRLFHSVCGRHRESRVMDHVSPSPMRASDVAILNSSSSSFNAIERTTHATHTSRLIVSKYLSTTSPTTTTAATNRTRASGVVDQASPSPIKSSEGAAACLSPIRPSEMAILNSSRNARIREQERERAAMRIKPWGSVLPLTRSSPFNERQQAWISRIGSRVDAWSP